MLFVLFRGDCEGAAETHSAHLGASPLSPSQFLRWRGRGRGRGYEEPAVVPGVDGVHQCHPVLLPQCVSGVPAEQPRLKLTPVQLIHHLLPLNMQCSSGKVNFVLKDKRVYSCINGQKRTDIINKSRQMIFKKYSPGTGKIVLNQLSQPAPGLGCHCRRVGIGRGHGCSLRFPKWYFNY